MRQLVNLFRVALIAALAFGAWRAVQWIRTEQDLLARENEAIALYNEQRFEAAAETLEAVLEAEGDADTERAASIRSFLARVYADWAAIDHGLSFEETLRLYRRAQALDPDVEVPPMLRRVLDRRPDPPDGPSMPP